MVRNVEMHLARRDAEAERRCARLGPAGTEHEDEAAEEEPGGVAEEDSDGVADDPGNNYFRLLRDDKHLVDIDRQFKFPGDRGKDIKKPAGWPRAVRMATEIHINDMRLQTFVLEAIYSSHHHNPFLFGHHVPNHALRKPQLCPPTGALLEIHYDECHIADWHTKFEVEESSTYAPSLGHYFYRSISFKSNHISFGLNAIALNGFIVFSSMF